VLFTILLNLLSGMVNNSADVKIKKKYLTVTR